VAVVRVDASMASTLKVAPVVQHAIARELPASGRVQCDDARIARLAALVPGQVRGLRVSIGDEVHQGDVVFSLNSRDAALAIEDRVDATRDVDLAAKTLAMNKDLFEHKAVSRIVLDQSQTDYDKARARLERTETALSAFGLGAEANSAVIPVASPLAGTVLERHISEGQFVQADSAPLIVVADLSSVWVMADVFERDLSSLHTGDAATVTTAAYPNEEFHARITHIGDAVDPATRAVPVRLVVANPQGRLKPEMFATIRVDIGATEPALTLPSSAILTEGDHDFVYVEIKPGVFARKPVEVSVEAGDERRVKGGLTAGDRVVTTGALLLRGQEDRGGN
jgi:cobalt-zinc-cadmium efflux system membrane fusion protein